MYVFYLCFVLLVIFVLVRQFKQQHEHRQQRARQKYQNHKKTCKNSTLSKNFYSRWKYLDYHRTNLSENLQIDSHGLTDFFGLL